MNTVRTLSTATSEAGETYVLGDAVVTFAVPDRAVMSAVGKILRGPEGQVVAHEPHTTVSARSNGDGWLLEVDGAVVQRLAQRTPAARVAEELIATACVAVAGKTNSILIAGAVLTKDGKTLALIGGDLDSARVIGFHLHARRWSAIAFRYAFLSRASLSTIGLHSLAVVSSSSIDQMPTRYRPAIEVSLWYDTGFDLAFYTVEPLVVHSSWLPSTPLTHVVLVDGKIDDEPSLDVGVGPSDARVIGQHADAGSLRVARLTLGTPVASCNILEKWITGAADAPVFSMTHPGAEI